MSYHYNLGLRFQSMARRFAEKPALRLSGAGDVTYRALNALANRVARVFLSAGVRRGDVVCLVGIKEVHTYAALLACLKIGAPYSFLDPVTPPVRLQRILDNCRPRLVVSGGDVDAHLARVPLQFTRLAAADLPAMVESQRDTNLDGTAAVVGTHPAYIMYTSGSTGVPKGAAIAHAAVLNLARWSQEAIGIDDSSCLSNLNPLYFDNSVFDVYAAFLSGATLVPVAPDIVADAGRLLRTLDHAACTVWFSVPSLLIYLLAMKALRRDSLPALQTMVFGGEGFPKAKLHRLFELIGERVALINVYGPTECTCICSSYRISSADFDELSGFPPLGRLAPNFDYMIDNAEADGIGELCLLGPQVGLGYYRDEERTRRSFVPSPNDDGLPTVMYRTGDLVREDPADGRLFILGRVDHQIKHLGYRIELEEIEAALARLHYLAQAVVVHGTIRGLSQILAVVSVTEPVKEATLRDDLTAYLPPYMIPTRIEFVSEIPKNANGKVDRPRVAELYLQS